MTHKANVQVVTHMGREVTEDIERVRNEEEAMTQILHLKNLCLPTSEGRVVSKWVQEGVKSFPVPLLQSLPFSGPVSRNHTSASHHTFPRALFLCNWTPQFSTLP